MVIHISYSLHKWNVKEEPAGLSTSPSTKMRDRVTQSIASLYCVTRSIVAHLSFSLRASDILSYFCEKIPNGVFNHLVRLYTRWRHHNYFIRDFIDHTNSCYIIKIIIFLLFYKQINYKIFFYYQSSFLLTNN